MKSKNTNKSSCLVACFGLALAVAAYTPLASTGNQQLVDMDKVHWSLKSDRFRCELELRLKKIGAISFSHLAGQPLQLNYVPASQFPHQVQVAAATPPWRGTAYSKAEPMVAASGRYQLATEQTLSLLRAMDNGLWTVLQLDQQEVLIPTIRWEEASEPFRACQDKLSPLSINDARDVTLYYTSGRRALSEPQLEEIATLSRYLQIDAQVTRVLVDAYTDDVGSRAGNLQISRERAADVAAALVSGGVSSEMIEQRSHGSRYPSADNSTQEGRDLNRKVTIRVIRQNGRKS